VVPPPTRRQLVGGKQLRLVARHAVEDVEQRVLLELREVARLEARRVVEVAGWDLVSPLKVDDLHPNHAANNTVDGMAPGASSGAGVA
jgi:hypothetical protein